jgi:hypothetical protein
MRFPGKWGPSRSGAVNLNSTIGKNSLIGCINGDGGCRRLKVISKKQREASPLVVAVQWWASYKEYEFLWHSADLFNPFQRRFLYLINEYSIWTLFAIRLEGH